MVRAFFTLWVAGLGVAAAQDHAGQYTQADIERGLRTYGANCTPCHGLNGDQVPGADLRSARYRRAASDEELARVVTTGIPGTAMPPHNLDRSELVGIVAYLHSLRDGRTGPVTIGDAGRGKLLFDGKGGCTACHRAAGQGSRVAPDLSEIGAIRTPERLQQSLLDPTSAMLPMNRPIRAVTRDGKTITGRRLNEDTYSVQLMDSAERLVSLSKADLKEYTIVKVSPMQSYRGKLNPAELADIVAYLLTLKGVN